MSGMIVASWIFVMLFLAFNLCCGVWGLLLWRKLTRIEHALAVTSDATRAENIGRAQARCARKFREARWCFFLSLDAVTVLGYFLVSAGQCGVW